MVGILYPEVAGKCEETEVICKLGCLIFFKHVYATYFDGTTVRVSSSSNEEEAAPPFTLMEAELTCCAASMIGTRIPQSIATSYVHQYELTPIWDALVEIFVRFRPRETREYLDTKKSEVGLWFRSARIIQVGLPLHPELGESLYRIVKMFCSKSVVPKLAVSDLLAEEPGRGGVRSRFSTRDDMTTRTMTTCSFDLGDEKIIKYFRVLFSSPCWE